MRNKREVFAGPTPAHLMTTADSPAKALTLAAKLCMRANDTSKGRQIKLKNYIELDKLFSGSSLPDDIHLFVRTKYDMPPKYEENVYDKLKKMDWKPAWIPDPTLLKSVEFGK
ncbi:MAG: hypothetical protein HZA00_06230 [Nitrospinae bacterium]|nr:hypothetical protein [Nitrospinota bacterium]